MCHQPGAASALDPAAFPITYPNLARQSSDSAGPIEHFARSFMIFRHSCKQKLADLKPAGNS